MRAHPLCALPPVIVAIVVAVSVGRGAARLSLIVAAGAAMCLELVARRLVRHAWQADLWPPSEGDPVALVALLAALVWTAGWTGSVAWLGEPEATAVRAGVLASMAIVATQAGAWLAARSARLRHPWPERPLESTHRRPGGSTAHRGGTRA